jgi:hypothetical protein
MPPKPGVPRRERKAARNADLKARRPQKSKVGIAGKQVQPPQRVGRSKGATKRAVNKGSR